MLPVSALSHLGEVCVCGDRPHGISLCLEKGGNGDEMGGCGGWMCGWVAPVS